MLHQKDREWPLALGQERFHTEFSRMIGTEFEPELANLGAGFRAVGRDHGAHVAGRGR